ncbi:MAG TPA: hypothetical protein VFZ61_19145, partial [Polyangiales bacterium]
MTPAQIMSVIDRYVIELRVGGGITELAGEMSRAVFASGATAATRLEQIFPPATFAEFADKVETLGPARRALIDSISRSPSLATLISRVVGRIVMDSLLPGSGRLIGSLRAQLEARFGPLLGRFVELRAEHAIDAHRAQLVEEISGEAVRAVADELFDALSNKRLSDSASVFTQQDLEDFVVLGYEYWLTFRRTAYFRSIVAEVVDRLFAKYGEESLVATLEDLGVDPSLLLGELKLFAGPIVALADHTGFLAQHLRALLEPFYASPDAAAALAATTAPRS